MGNLVYALFNSLETFAAWESKVSNELGLPNDFGTINYTNPIGKIGTDQVIAAVDETIDVSALTILSDQELLDGKWLRDLAMTIDPIYYAWNEATLSWDKITK
jgi:hypothetical protein